MQTHGRKQDHTENIVRLHSQTSRKTSKTIVASMPVYSHAVHENTTAQRTDPSQYDGQIGATSGFLRDALGQTTPY